MQGLEKLVHMPKITWYVTELDLSLVCYLLALLALINREICFLFFLSICNAKVSGRGPWWESNMQSFILRIVKWMNKSLTNPVTHEYFLLWFWCLVSSLVQNSQNFEITRFKNEVIFNWYHCKTPPNVYLLGCNFLHLWFCHDID